MLAAKDAHASNSCTEYAQAVGRAWPREGKHGPTSLRHCLCGPAYSKAPVRSVQCSAVSGVGTISSFRVHMPMAEHLTQLNIVRWTPERYAAFLDHVKRSEPLHHDGTMSHRQREFLERAWHRFAVRVGTGGEEELTFDSRPVVRQDRVQLLLQRYYDDVAHSRNGRDSLYARVSSEVYGITRRAVQRFLSTQESYQTHLPAVSHRVVQPIVANRPFSRWQVDLIDLSEFAYWNVGYSYALTCIDCFSKRAHVRQLKDRSRPSVAATMRMIFVASEALPSVVNSDRGTEFMSGEFQAVLSEHGVQHAPSSAYHPQSQGQVERFNQTLKRLLYAYMTRNDTKFWLRALPALFHADLNEQTRTGVHARLQRSADRSVERSSKKGRRTLRVAAEQAAGDTVRVSMITRASMRKEAMLGARKGYERQWSTELYTVASKSTPAVDGIRAGSAWYSLPDDEGQPVNKRYYAQQLQKVDRDALVRSAQRPLPQLSPSSASPQFNREAHVASLSARRREREPQDLPAVSAPEERRQGSVARERRPRRRLIEEGEEGEAE